MVVLCWAFSLRPGEWICYLCLCVGDRVKSAVKLWPHSMGRGRFWSNGIMLWTHLKALFMCMDDGVWLGEVVTGQLGNWASGIRHCNEREDN